MEVHKLKSSITKQGFENARKTNMINNPCWIIAYQCFTFCPCLLFFFHIYVLFIFMLPVFLLFYLLSFCQSLPFSYILNHIDLIRTLLFLSTFTAEYFLSLSHSYMSLHGHEHLQRNAKGVIKVNLWQI